MINYIVPRREKFNNLTLMKTSIWKETCDAFDTPMHLIYPKQPYANLSNFRSIHILRAVSKVYTIVRGAFYNFLDFNILVNTF